MRTILLPLSCLILSLVSQSIFAADGLDLPKVLFPPELNGVKVMQQKFEYQILDHDRMRIGDIVLDSRDLSFSVLEKEGKLRGTITWPSGLIKDGNIVLRDPSGLALDKVFMLPAGIEDKTNVGTNRAVAQYSWNVEPEARTRLSRASFFNFCIYRSDGKLDICSAKYIMNDSNQISPALVNDANSEGAVQVGKSLAGDQGKLYLTNEQTVIAFGAKTPAGMVIEVKSLSQDISFTDIAVQASGKIYLSGTGSVPLGRPIIKQGKDTWTIDLNREHPGVFLQAPGSLPLTQDIQLPENLPAENFRPKIVMSSTESYQEKIVVRGKKTKVQTLKGREPSSTMVSENETFRWTVNVPERGVLQRKEMNVSVNGNDFVASIPIFRDWNQDLNATINTGTSSSRGMAYRYWLSDSGLHWGWAAAYRMYEESKDVSTVVDGKVYYRVNTGLQRRSNTLGILGAANRSSLDSKLTPMIGIFGQWRRPLGSSFFGDIWNAEAMMGGDKKFRWDLQAEYHFGDNRSYILLDIQSLRSQTQNFTQYGIGLGVQF